MFGPDPRFSFYLAVAHTVQEFSRRYPEGHLDKVFVANVEHALIQIVQNEGMSERQARKFARQAAPRLERLRRAMNLYEATKIGVHGNAADLAKNALDE